MCEESALGWRSALALRFHCFNKLCHSEPSGDAQRRRCARNLLLGGAALQRCDFIASTSFVIPSHLETRSGEDVRGICFSCPEPSPPCHSEGPRSHQRAEEPR